jgi:hypothetical protein
LVLILDFRVVGPAVADQLAAYAPDEEVGLVRAVRDRDNPGRVVVRYLQQALRFPIALIQDDLAEQALTIVEIYFTDLGMADGDQQPSGVSPDLPIMAANLVFVWRALPNRPPRFTDLRKGALNRSANKSYRRTTEWSPSKVLASLGDEIALQSGKTPYRASGTRVVRFNPVD